MKKILIFSLCVFCVAGMQAQHKFNVQNGTKTEFYDDLEIAIQKAVPGDTIYLPGAVIQVNNDELIIDKKLAIIGAGWDIDSIGGVLPSQIKNGNNFGKLNFREGSDGSLIMGCELNEITFGHDIFYDIENITIARNKISYGINIAYGVFNSNIILPRKITIQENCVQVISGNSRKIDDCIIKNNYVYNYISNFKKSNIYNNVISGLSSLDECIVENNYIASWSSNTIDNCIHNNNAFKEGINFPKGTNVGSNNQTNQEVIQTFVAISNLSYDSQPKNMKIRDTSPCKNAGTDGTDIGIYGGSTPYKAGAVPPQPHIDKFLVSPQADKAGNLNVAIQVSSQTR